MDLLEDAALLWRRILTADPDAIFGPEASRLLNRNWADHLAQPGYMGAKCRPGGLVFVSMNPGAGPQAGLSAEDQRQYEALQHLRDADEFGVRAVFDELTRVLTEIMPVWRIYQNFVDPVLHALGLDFSEVAYVNLLKWRTKTSSGLARPMRSVGTTTRATRLSYSRPGTSLLLAATPAVHSGYTTRNPWTSISSRVPSATMWDQRGGRR